MNYVETRLLRPSRLQLRERVGNIQELQQSIKENGLLQPIIVRPKEDYLEVIAGNRRLSACKQLHLSKVLCMIKEVSDKEAYEIALTENIQRNTLDPIEEARAFKNYIDDFGYGGIVELACEIGKSEEYISHRIHLLSLPSSIIDKVRSRLLAPTTADELVWLKDPEAQLILAEASIKERLSARKVRSAIRLVRRKVEIGQAIKNVTEAKSDFDKEYVRDRTKNENIKALTEAILVLKSTLIHFDPILDRSLDLTRVKEELISKRFGIHQLLDELISLRKSILNETDGDMIALTTP